MRLSRVNEFVLSAVALVVVLVVMYAMLFSGCVPVTAVSEQSSGPYLVSKMADGVYRVEDTLNGVLCYYSYQGGMFCLKK
jgi:hypothetical protein